MASRLDAMRRWRAHVAVLLFGASALLLVGACGPTQGGVAGSVIADAACPSASATSCPSQPLGDLPLTIVRVSDSIVVAQPTTSPGGTFAVQLDPGRYRVHGAGVFGLVAPAPVFFDVSPGSTTPVEIRYADGTR
jgi:hypothetical protein